MSYSRVPNNHGEGTNCVKFSLPSGAYLNPPRNFQNTSQPPAIQSPPFMKHSRENLILKALAFLSFLGRAVFESALKHRKILN